MKIPYTHANPHLFIYNAVQSATRMCLVIGTGDPKAKNMEAPYPIEFCSSWGSSENQKPCRCDCEYVWTEANSFYLFQGTISHNHGKSKIFSAAQQGRGWGKTSCVTLYSTGSQEGQCPALQRTSSFFMSRLAAWTRPLGVEPPVCCNKTLLYNILSHLQAI